VIDEFPDGVGIGQDVGCGLFSAQPGQYFPYWRAVPWVTVKGTMELIGDAKTFGIHKNIGWSSV
jgi:hypothetical protein